MRKSLKFGAAAATLALALTGCASNAAPTAAPASPSATSAAPLAGSLTVWADANRQPVLKTLADQFKADTGVTVTIVPKDNAKLRDEFITAAPTGKGPDIIFGAHDWTGKLVQNGVVAPVELGATAGNYQEVAVKAFTYDGKVYGVPYAVENIALVRNTDLAPDAPATWDDLVKTGKDAVAAKKAKYPILIQQDAANSDPYHLYPIQASFGAPVFNTAADGSVDDSTVAMGGENGAKFAAALAQMGKDKLLNLNISADIAKEQFTKGQSPYMITGPWNIGDIKKAGIKYGVSEIPSVGGQPATPFVGVQGAFVSAKSANAVAANKLLVEYLGSEKVQTALYSDPTGQRPPANKAAFEAAKSDADVAAFGAVGAAGTPMPNVPAMDNVWADWGKAQAAIVKGTDDPAKTWQAAVDAIQKKIAG